MQVIRRWNRSGKCPKNLGIQGSVTFGYVGLAAQKNIDDFQKNNNKTYDDSVIRVEHAVPIAAAVDLNDVAFGTALCLLCFLPQFRTFVF
jgi:hypothetical protein